MLMARVGELEARLGASPKTPDNSSTPPARGQKPNHPSRPSVTCALADNPDRVVEATTDACPHCACRLSSADLPGAHVSNNIDLPPIRPAVTRIYRYHSARPCCRKRVTAPAPDSFA